MSDKELATLVERLREGHQNPPQRVLNGDLLLEAAAEIGKLRRERAELLEALDKGNEHLASMLRIKKNFADLASAARAKGNQP